MNSKLVLLVLCSLAGGAVAKNYYGYYGQFESCYQKGKDFCKGTETCSADEPTTLAALTSSQAPSCVPAVTSTEASVETTSQGNELIICPCKLMDYLSNITFALEGTYSEIYIQWLYEIQITILSDQSYTEEEKFLKVIASLKFLFEEYSEIKIALQYVQLFEFGYVCDLFTIATEYQVELSITEQLLVWNGKSCLFFEAFYNATWLSSEQLAELEILFSEIKINVLNGQYTYTEEVVLIYERFLSFFEKHESWKLSFYNVSIEGFGCFSEWLSIGQTYYYLWTLELQIGGDAASCPVLAAILAYSNDASIDIGVRLQIKNFYSAVLSKFQTTTSIYARLEILINVTQEFSVIAGFDIHALYSIVYKFKFHGHGCHQSFYELLFQAFYYFKYGFSCGLPLESTTTSAPVTTTTGYTLTCDAASSDLLTTNDASTSNQCPIVYSMWQTYYSNSWTTTCMNALKPVITRCHNYITSFSNNGSSSQQKANAIFNYLAANPTNNAVCQQYILKVVIKLKSGVAWGRVCDFASCTHQSGANLACSS